LERLVVALERLSDAVVTQQIQQRITYYELKRDQQAFEARLVAWQIKVNEWQFQIGEQLKEHYGIDVPSGERVQ
jgi:hypothetical protein